MNKKKISFPDFKKFLVEFNRLTESIIAEIVTPLRSVYTPGYIVFRNADFKILAYSLFANGDIDMEIDINLSEDKEFEFKLFFIKSNCKPFHEIKEIVCKLIQAFEYEIDMPEILEQRCSL